MKQSLPAFFLTVVLLLSSCTVKSRQHQRPTEIPIQPVDEYTYILDSCHYRKICVGAHAYQYIHSSKCPHCAGRTHIIP